jgi:PKD repeat protein
MRAFTTILILFLATASFFDAKAELVNVSGFVIEDDNSQPLNNHVLLVTIKSPNSPLIFQEKLFTDDQGFYNNTFKIPYSFGYVQIATVDCNNHLQTFNGYFSPLTPNVVANFFICFEQGMSFCSADFAYSRNPGNQSQVLFRQTAFGDHLQFEWDFGDGNTSDLPNPVNVFSEPGIYEVCLAISDTSGNCTDVICRNVEIAPQITACPADFVYFPVTESPGTYEFIDLSSPDVFSWEWDFDDGTTSKLQNPVHTFQSTGSFNVCLTVETTDCTEIFCQEIIVDQTESCLAGFDFLINPDNPLQVTFNDNSLGNPDSWSWDFGDSATSVLQSPQHTYEAPGIYQVCFSIQNSITGCQDESCQIIFLLDEPFCNAYFNYYYLALDPVSIQFADMSLGNITGYQWDFGDGNTSDLPNPVHSFFEDGTYQVCLTVSGQDGCEDTFCTYVIVNGNVECEASFDYMINYDNIRQIAFLDNSTGDIDQWQWDFGDGNFSEEKNPVHLYQDEGIYLACLTVSDSTNPDCQSQVCNYVHVSEEYFCDSQFDYFVSPENPLQIQFANKSSGNIDFWIWDFGDGGYSNEKNPLHEFGEEAEYRVCLVGIDLNSFCLSTVCKNITVANTSQLSAGFTHTISSENPFLVQFEDNSTGEVATRLWDFGDGNTSSQQNPQHLYGSEGSFEVCLTVINPQGNQSSTACDTVVIEAPDLCIADFDIEIVENELPGVQFTDISQGIANAWEWDFGDGNSSTLQNPLHFYQDSGSYTVQLKIYHSDSIFFCADSIDKNIQVVTPAPSCQADFSFSVDSALNTPLQFHFQDMSENNPDEWLWDFGDGNTSNEQNPSHQYEEGGEYTVQLTVTKHNPFGPACSDTRIQTITTPAYYHIGGFVYAGDYPINNPVHTGDTAMIYLYRHHGAENIFCIDTALFTTNGYYFALYLLEDHYLIKARLTNNSTNARNYFPAYYGDQLLWQDAPAYFLTQTHQYDLDINLVPLPERPEGPGLISGSVRHISPEKGNLPGQDAQVLLFDAQNAPLDYVFSDKEGNFDFEALEPGTYKMIAESAGLYTEPVYVTITVENPAIADVQLMLYPYDITGIDDMAEAVKTDINIFPNPVNDVLNIHLQDPVESLTDYQVLSVSGNVFMEGTLSPNHNRWNFQINTGRLPKGVYLLKLQPTGQFPAAVLKFIK